MAKTYKDYSKEEIKELLKQAENVVQHKDDYDDEFHILIKKGEDLFESETVEVVSAMTAIRNEDDFSDSLDRQFLFDTIEALLNGEELLQIGAYDKLADDLFWREF